MRYDPIKTTLGKFFNKTTGRRKLFYRLLDLLLLRTWYIRKELKRFARMHPGPVSVLDAGTGFGQYVCFMQRKFRNWRVHGIDINEDQLRDVIQFFNKIDSGKRLSFEVADLEKYGTDKTFDLILCVDVMEHIPDDHAVFRNFSRSLKPGGMLLISTPSDLGGSDVHDESDKSFIEEHVRDGYNIEAIQKQLSEAGFIKTKAYYSYGKPGHISWLLSMKYPILMVNNSKLFFLLLPFYYLITFPPALLLNLVEVSTKHRRGTGLIVKAWK
ncbi:MAG: class I SAM-dependent methyltransferase [Chlorobi bacterium]|nr:class I SAM-dependent methyltransferase [Chlorobiota bacterium]